MFVLSYLLLCCMYWFFVDCKEIFNFKNLLKYVKVIFVNIVLKCYIFFVFVLSLVVIINCVYNYCLLKLRVICKDEVVLF